MCRIRFTSQAFKMTESKHINLFDLKQYEQEDNGLKLIHMLMDFGAFQKNLKCIRGHVMTLEKDQSTSDKFKWKCRYTYKDPKQKQKKYCNYR